MPPAPPRPDEPPPRAPRRSRRRALGAARGLLALTLLGGALREPPGAGERHAPAGGRRFAWLPEAAAESRLAALDVTRQDDGVYLAYGVDIELGRGADDALGKAVPLFFVAEAQLFRSRFYWRDLRVGQAIRRWRIVYQPLTGSYRVTYDGGISQNFPSRSDALAAISHGSGWKIAESAQIDDGSHYVEFAFRLDTSQLPRPMQIGIGGQADWSLDIERRQKL